MDAVENQRQVSHRAHTPWKSHTARFPHSHPGDEGAEKWKTKGTFPTFPLDVFVSSKTTQKGGLAAGRFAPAFRLILQLENARVLQKLGFQEKQRGTIMGMESIIYCLTSDNWRSALFIRSIDG